MRSEAYNNKFRREKEVYTGRHISMFARDILQKLVEAPTADRESTGEIYTDTATIRLSRVSSQESNELYSYIVNQHDKIGTIMYMTHANSPHVYVNRTGGSGCRISSMPAFDAIELMEHLRGIQNIAEPTISTEGERRFRSIVAGIAMDEMNEKLTHAAQDKGSRALTHRKLRQLPIGSSSQTDIPKM